jgi:plastocyanin
MRSLVAAGTVLLCLTAVGCAKKSTTTPAAGGTSSASASTTAPVALSGTVNDHGSVDLAGKTAADVEADNFYFNPTFIKAAPGSTVKVSLRNEGSATHTFTVAGTTIDQTLAPGAKASVSVTLPASGALAFYCRFHKGQGMQGAFYGRAGDTVAPGAATSSSDGGGAYGSG